MFTNSFDMIKRHVLVGLLLFIGAAQGALAQTAPAQASRLDLGPGERPWYVGVQGGTSFGQATFSSITGRQNHWGIQGGVFGGYRFNRLISLEAVLQYGGQDHSALDCCDYWLTSTGERFMVPVLDEKGWYYRDLLTRTQWGRVALQANVDLLSLVTRPGSRWSLNLSPQISAVTTRTTLTTPDSQAEYAGKAYPRQWHLGLGGQVSAGYQISDRLAASLYGGVAALTGERFDNIPVHLHKTNLLWDAGVKLSFSFGKPGRAAVDDDAARRAAEEAARLAQAQAEAERLAREKAEQERQAAEAARAEAERLAREKAEREAAEAAAAKDRAFHTPIPTVYFAHNKHLIDAGYVPSLEEALAILKKYPDFNLEIHAYASQSGTKSYNNRLSEKRMEAIRAWFADHGIAPERMLQAYFHGIDYNAPSADKARRAELQFAK
jgi:outer membrane protein OmpA-like peptidoglycan-associated protein